LSKNDTAWAIEVEALKKRFKSHSGGVEALKGISFQVQRGGIFCILGPNGAGKTTLLRILTTVMKPSAGNVHIEGFETGRQNLEIRSLIGIVAQGNFFDRYLNVWQNLILHAEMHGLPRPDSETRIRELLTEAGLYERRMDFLDDFSGGMQRRVALIRALLHKPKVLFLDEPTTGLDPSARRDLWATVESIRHDTTVILTTHYMEEADRLSDRILILDQGTVLMEGTANELKRRIAPPNTYELRLSVPLAEMYRNRLADYIDFPRVVEDNRLQFKLKDAGAWPKLTEAIAPENLISLGLLETDLETVYLTVAGHRDRSNNELDVKK
jgi:ABC-2 type transport system ATP-binding protein